MPVIQKLFGTVATLALAISLSPAGAGADPIDPDEGGGLLCYPVERCFEFCQTDADGGLTCERVCGVAFVCPGLGGGGGGGDDGGGIGMCDGLTGKDKVRCEQQQAH